MSVAAAGTVPDWPVGEAVVVGGLPLRAGPHPAQKATPTAIASSTQTVLRAIDGACIGHLASVGNPSTPHEASRAAPSCCQTVPAQVAVGLVPPLPNPVPAADPTGREIQSHCTLGLLRFSPRSMSRRDRKSTR